MPLPLTVGTGRALLARFDYLPALRSLGAAAIYDARYGLVLSTTSVDQWSDLSGNGYHLTSSSSNRPTWSATSGPGGIRPALSFSAASIQRLDATSGAALNILRNVDGGSAVLVWRPSASAAVQTGLSITTASGTTRFGVVRASTTSIRHTARRLDGDSSVNLVGTIANAAPWRITTMISDYATRNAYVYDGGVLLASNNAWLSGGSTSNTASTFMRVGAGPTLASPTEPLEGGIAAVIVFARALTNMDRAMVEALAASSWGI